MLFFHFTDEVEVPADDSGIVLSAHTNDVFTLAISKRFNCLLSGSQDDTAILWALEGKSAQGWIFAMLNNNFTLFSSTNKLRYRSTRRFGRSSELQSRRDIAGKCGDEREAPHSRNDIKSTSLRGI